MQAYTLSFLTIWSLDIEQHPELIQHLAEIQGVVFHRLEHDQYRLLIRAAQVILLKVA